MSEVEWIYGDPTRELETTKQVDEIGDELLKDLASASYGLGNNFTVDWERFYDMLETQHGWVLEDWENPADNKIRRKVRKWIREGEVE